MSTLPLRVHIQAMAYALQSGWTVRYVPTVRVFCWRKPNGMSGALYESDQLVPVPDLVLAAFLCADDPTEEL